MRSSDESKRILRRAVELAARDGNEAEASLYGGRYGITRFSDNKVNHPIDGSLEFLRLRIIVDGKEGVSQTTDLTDEGIIRTIQEATKMAHNAPEPDDTVSLASPQEYNDQDAFDAETDRASVVDRMNLVGATIVRAHAHGLRASGHVATAVGGSALTNTAEFEPYAIENSRELSAYHSSTHASIRVGMFDARNHAGWANSSSFMFAALNAEGIIEVAAQKACAPGEIRGIKAGRYRCVIEPAAVKELLQRFGETCGAQMQSDGLSPLANRENEQITSEKITIRDDFSHEQIRATPFDAEGISRKPVSIIEQGIAKGPVYSYASARRFGVEPTGHSFYCPHLGKREIARHLVMEGGDKGLVELVSECDQAILISGLGSVSVLDHQKLTISGVTQGGTFLIRGGKVVCPIKNMSFVINLFDLFNSVEELSATIACETFVTPALRVSEFALSPC